MSEATTVSVDPAPAAVQSPPPSESPAHDSPAPDPRQMLHRLAAELMRASNRRLLVEFLQLRRALR